MVDVLRASGRRDALPVQVVGQGAWYSSIPPAPPRSFGGWFHIANRYSQAETVERAAELAHLLGGVGDLMDVVQIDLFSQVHYIVET